MSGTTVKNDWKVGDIVYPNTEAGWNPIQAGTKCVITKVPRGGNQVNFQAMPCDDEGNEIPGARGFKGRSYAFTDVAPKRGSRAVPAEMAHPVNPPIASLVRPSPTSNIPAGVYAVIGHTDSQRVRIQRLGGDGGRYWRAYSKHLTTLDPAAVEAALADI